MAAGATHSPDAVGSAPLQTYGRIVEPSRGERPESHRMSAPSSARPLNISRDRYASTLVTRRATPAILRAAHRGWKSRRKP